MRLPRKKSKASRLEAAQELKDTASFGGDLEDFTVLRHHAVRALCGFLMDRHSACGGLRTPVVRLSRASRERRCPHDADRPGNSADDSQR